jgi:hypothetical protein
MVKPRYDADKDESRHAAVDESACREMARRNGWELIDVDETGVEILEADCVFKGKTEFPSFHKED